MRAPLISSSTKEQRRRFIQNIYHCIADCDNCGLCVIFKNKDPEFAYEDYIEGKREFLEVSKDYK